MVEDTAPPAVNREQLLALMASGSGLDAGHLARQLGVPRDVLRPELDAMCARGELTAVWDLLCGDCHNTIESFDAEEQVRIGDEVECLHCSGLEPQRVDGHSVWVTYQLPASA